jgi:transcriptional antiterminator RfaH
MKEVAGTISSPMAELLFKTGEPTRAWYCVRTHLKHEHIAAAHLQLLPEVQVFNPRLRLLRSTRRGRIWSTESLFPNYVFARFVLESTLEKVRYTSSITKVLRFGDTVPAIPDPVIENLRQELDELKDKVLTDAPEEGEEVEVGAGAFKGLTGQVTRVLPAKQRVQILLDFMGRSIAAELSLEMVLFRKREASRVVLPATAVLDAHWSGFPEPELVGHGSGAERSKGASRESGWQAAAQANFVGH